MNGFEPLRRRIIDYTEAGQWSEVYDGPLEDCESEKLKAENAKLRELLVGAFEDMDAWQKVIAGSNEWGYGKGCLDRLCKLRDAMQELGMEVEVR